jgi:hypothetical protein
MAILFQSLLFKFPFIYRVNILALRPPDSDRDAGPEGLCFSDCSSEPLDDTAGWSRPVMLSSCSSRSLYCECSDCFCLSRASQPFFETVAATFPSVSFANWQGRCAGRFDGRLSFKSSKDTQTADIALNFNNFSLLPAVFVAILPDRCNGTEDSANHSHSHRPSLLRADLGQHW